ncbi:hypothetical protein AA12717_1142 [Gluconacetobacter sacchari DSM 12717]|uniref:Uncharacterized protein n=1 Tax=Gluconacetobacter sacchari DSM 12717 TaxID=1307940 RepID=A0ABQ0P4W6_9PROT|nr:hypothetical protein AA12717_1142 [Gluconacetobacter sacchari DSM 12717]
MFDIRQIGGAPVDVMINPADPRADGAAASVPWPGAWVRPAAGGRPEDAARVLRAQYRTILTTHDAGARP